MAAARQSDEEDVKKPGSHGFWLLAVTGFATRCDAMAVGVRLAFLEVNIPPSAIAIGIATFAMVTIGVMVGRVLGSLAGGGGQKPSVACF